MNKEEKITDRGINIKKNRKKLDKLKIWMSY